MVVQSSKNMKLQTACTVPSYPSNTSTIEHSSNCASTETPMSSRKVIKKTDGYTLKTTDSSSVKSSIIKLRKNSFGGSWVTISVKDNQVISQKWGRDRNKMVRTTALMARTGMKTFFGITSLQADKYLYYVVRRSTSNFKQNLTPLSFCRDF